MSRSFEDASSDDPRALGRRAGARAVCSCRMCGNPRRYFNEPTLQERKHRLDAES